MKKIKLMKETFLSIIDGSTVHGLPNIFRTTLIILKLIWFMSLTASVLACAFFIMQSINDYLNFDFVTNIDNIYARNLQFPTISFCSTSNNFDKVTLQSILKQCYYKNDPDCFYNHNKYFETFDDTLYGISLDKFVDELLPKTSSLVRGEELLELLNLIVRFLTTHTHAYPGLPPVPVTQDGSSVANMLTEMQNAYTKILNGNM